MPRKALLCLPAVAACAPPRPASAGRPTAGLTDQFARSAEAWNRGDVDGFVADDSVDSLGWFVSGGRLSRGITRIRRNYAPRCAAGAARDSLRFEEFTVRPLTPALATVAARFIPYKDGRTKASGPFTLEMARGADGWKILHDHSSSD